MIELLLILPLVFAVFFAYNRMLYWKDAAEEVEEMLYAHQRVYNALMKHVQDLAEKNKKLQAENQELKLKLEKSSQDYWSKS